MKVVPAVHLALLLGSSIAGASAGTPLQGTVLETIDAGQSSYLRLKTSNGEVRAAVPAGEPMPSSGMTGGSPHATAAPDLAVVKFLPSIMGKNWIHLRGVVRTDIDLGLGYSYKVIVEDAIVQK